EQALLLKRQVVEPARRGKGALDQFVGDAVVQHIEKSDVLTCVGNLGRYVVERSRHTGKTRAIIDHRDQPRRRGIIADRLFFEEMHSVLYVVSCGPLLGARSTPSAAWYVTCHPVVDLMERVKGIEPSSEAWEAPALPLSYTRAAPMIGN